MCYITVYYNEIRHDIQLIHLAVVYSVAVVFLQHVVNSQSDSGGVKNEGS